MSRVWKLKPKAPEDFLRKFPQYSPLISQLLYDRGLLEPEDVEEFFNVEYGKLHDPFLFLDMAKAVARIWQAIENKENIFIYGDYDADAVTANAVLQQTFRYLGVEVQSYIPDRFTEGYGLNVEAFEKIRSAGANLVITVDCGTNSLDVAEYCKKNGIDLIITDHHEILDGKPDAFALINPKNPDDRYPCQDITGVGVAFKLACGILSEQDKVSSARRKGGSRPVPTGEYHQEGWEKWLLDLVAIGTVADCHSLIGENRILVKYGLMVLRKTRWVGLRALMRSAALDLEQRPPDTYTLGFIIAPRLNAAGRLEHADIALHLLMENDPIKAQERAFALEEINRRRQGLTERVMSEAREKIIPIQDRKIIVLMAEGWPKGVVGLAAGKIAEEFGKPTIVLEKNDGQSTGSARTVGEFDIMKALKSVSDQLVRFGGHKQAAGLTLETDKFEEFYQQLLRYAETHLKEEDLQRSLVLDAELSSAYLTLDTLEELKKFEPFGTGNPRPKFAINDCKVLAFRVVGANGQHLQMTLEKNNTTVPSVAFGWGKFAQNLKIGDTINIAAELMEDGWNGRREVKLRVIDIKQNNN